MKGQGVKDAGLLAEHCKTGVRVLKGGRIGNGDPEGNRGKERLRRGGEC